MKNVNENILTNVTGDYIRKAIGLIPGLNIPTGVVSVVLNSEELDDTMERYYDLTEKFENGEQIDNLYGKLTSMEKELIEDFVDMLQSGAEMGIPGIKIMNILGFPLVTALGLEKLLIALSKFIDFDDPKNSMTPALAAIKHIGDIKRKIKKYKTPEDLLDSILPPITEGRKKTGTKLCSRGKSAAKAKFDVYPSAYANGYAIQVCKGKIKGLDGKKRCSPPYC